MAPAATRPHVAAITGLLTAAGLAVLPGGEGSPTPPCVVLWPTPGEPDASALGNTDALLTVEVTTVACGATADQAMWVADKITTVLNRATPTVSGRAVRPIHLVDASSVRRDDDLASPIHSAALRWRLVTTT